VPFSFIIEKLDAFQKSFYIVAQATSGRQTGARGNYSKYIRSSCELLFKSSSKGSLAINAMLPDVLSLFPDETNNGYFYFDSFMKFLNGIADKDEKSIIDLIPDRSSRSRALRSIKKLVPDGKFGLEILRSNTSKTAISRKFTEVLDTFLGTDEIEEGLVVTLYGEAIEIRVKAGKKHIVVYDKNREITCYYSTDIEDSIKMVLPGTLIQLKGSAQVNERSEVIQIDEIYDIDQIILGEFTVDRFNAFNREFLLNKPVPCISDYKSGLWVFECPRYKLHSFHTDRALALEQFNEEFIIVCDGILHEPDNNLSHDAIELKNILLNDIKK
jgi:hypothetical protein